MKTVILSLALLAAASAFANEAADEQMNRQSFTSTATRAEVRSEYIAARQAGTLPVTSEAASLVTQAVSTRSDRDVVRQEARVAARQRQVDLLP